jgi:hypothetical protein
MQYVQRRLHLSVNDTRRSRARLPKVSSNQGESGRTTEAGIVDGAEEADAVTDPAGRPPTRG